MSFEVSAIPYQASSDSEYGSISAVAGSIAQPEAEAIEEVGIFLDVAAARYSEAGLPARADAVLGFADSLYFVDDEMCSAATTAFADELVAVADAVPRLTLLHASAEDAKDRFVGSSEFIVNSIVAQLKGRGLRVGKDFYVEDVPTIQARGIASGEKIMMYDDWIITGGQVRRLTGAAGIPTENLGLRFVALRENWHDLLPAPLELPGDLQYYREAAAIGSLVAGPSIIGSHSSANIGWQNRLAVFGLDLAAITEQPVPLPGLGAVTRPYRTRVEIPHYYRKPPLQDLVSYRYRHGLQLDGFAELSLEALTKHFATGKP